MTAINATRAHNELARLTGSRPAPEAAPAGDWADALAVTLLAEVNAIPTEHNIEMVALRLRYAHAIGEGVAIERAWGTIRGVFGERR